MTLVGGVGEQGIRGGRQGEQTAVETREVLVPRVGVSSFQVFLSLARWVSWSKEWMLVGMC